MELQSAMGGFVALQIFLIAGFSGWVIIGRAPSILHAPLAAVCTFLHGIVVVAGLYVLLNAVTAVEQMAGFCMVLLGAVSVAGGYAVSARMLSIFRSSVTEVAVAVPPAAKPNAPKRARSRPKRSKKI